MSTVTLPPIGAQVRAVITHFSTAGNTTVTVEGIVSAHLDEMRFVVGKPQGTVVNLETTTPRDTATVDVLAMPLPPEPDEGTVVQIGDIVLIRRTFATDGPERCWRATNHESPWTWAEICQSDTPVRLVPDPAASGHELPWFIKDEHGSKLHFTPHTNGLWLEAWVDDDGNDHVRLYPNDAAAAGRALLRWAGEHR